MHLQIEASRGKMENGHEVPAGIARYGDHLGFKASQLHISVIGALRYIGS